MMANAGSTRDMSSGSMVITAGGTFQDRPHIAEPCPDRAAPGVSVHSPVPRPGDRRRDIEPMRPPGVARPVTPRPSAVLHLDPEAILADLGAQCERAAVPGGAVQDRLVANSDAIRIASSACGQPPSHPASAARASPTCRGSAG